MYLYRNLVESKPTNVTDHFVSCNCLKIQTSPENIAKIYTIRNKQNMGPNKTKLYVVKPMGSQQPMQQVLLSAWKNARSWDSLVRKASKTTAKAVTVVEFRLKIPTRNSILKCRNFRWS